MAITETPAASVDIDANLLEVHRRIAIAWRELRRGASTTALRELLYGSGPDALDLGQIDTLDLLATEGPVRMGDLAGALRVDPSTATRAVDRLAAVGLAERRRSPADGRVVEVALTPDGAGLHAAFIERRRQVMAQLLAGFDRAERHALAELLERLVAGVDAFVAQGAG